MTTDSVFVGLGSNLGNRREQLRHARSLIEEKHDIIAQSPVVETRPEGVDTEALFMNQVIRLRINGIGPESFLEDLLTMEARMGRDRSNDPDRRIDLDLLYWGDVVRQRDPILPHPRCHSRAFVLRSMVEIAPTFVHPRFNKTQEELLEANE